MTRYLHGKLCNPDYAKASALAIREFYSSDHQYGIERQARIDFWNMYDGCFFE